MECECEVHVVGAIGLLIKCNNTLLTVGEPIVLGLVNGVGEEMSDCTGDSESL